MNRYERYMEEQRLIRETREAYARVRVPSSWNAPFVDPEAPAWNYASAFDDPAVFNRFPDPQSYPELPPTTPERAYYLTPRGGGLPIAGIEAFLREPAPEPAAVASIDTIDTRNYRMEYETIARSPPARRRPRNVLRDLLIR